MDSEYEDEEPKAYRNSYAKPLTEKKKGSGGLNTGRWTVSEHNLFMDCLNIFGRDWKKVTDKITSRSSAQIRSHAQKFFGKLQKDMGIILSSPVLAAYCEENKMPGGEHEGGTIELDGTRIAISYEKVDSLRRIEMKIMELLDERNNSTMNVKVDYDKITNIDDHILNLYQICEQATTYRSIWRKKLINSIVSRLTEGNNGGMMNDSAKELVQLQIILNGSDRQRDIKRSGSCIGLHNSPIIKESSCFRSSPMLNALKDVASVALNSELMNDFSLTPSMDSIMTPELKARVTNLGGDEMTALHALTCVFDSAVNNNKIDSPVVDENNFNNSSKSSKKRKLTIFPEASSFSLNQPEYSPLPYQDKFNMMMDVCSSSTNYPPPVYFLNNENSNTNQNTNSFTSMSPSRSLAAGNNLIPLSNIMSSTEQQTTQFAVLAEINNSPTHNKINISPMLSSINV